MGWLPDYGNHQYTINIVFKGNSVPATGIYQLTDLGETGQASLFIGTPKPNHKTYRAKSGELRLTNHGGIITASFIDVPIISDTGEFTSLASGRFTITFKIQKIYNNL